MNAEKQRSSMPSKLIAVSGVCITLFLAYNHLATGKIAECKARAYNISAKGIVEVLDVSWRIGGCRMLVRHRYEGAEARWSDELIISIYE